MVIFSSYIVAMVIVIIVNVRELALVGVFETERELMLKDCFPTQMALGRVPLLTRGPLALFFGGENIIDQLSEGSPGESESVFLYFAPTLCPCIFQPGNAIGDNGIKLVNTAYDLTIPHMPISFHNLTQ